MARNVFISFRFSDGSEYKEKLVRFFKSSEDVINYSEDTDRSHMNAETIRRHLYNKLKNTSVTIALLTPNAINYKKNYFGNIDDWIYDEVRYSLENRENNLCNGLIAVYTPEAKKYLIENEGETITIKNFEHLTRKNMFNIKTIYKHNKKENIYDANLDHYCTLVSWDDFISNINFYIEKAIYKRERKEQYDLTVRMQNNRSSF